MKTKTLTCHFDLPDEVPLGDEQLESFKQDVGELSFQSFGITLRQVYVVDRDIRDRPIRVSQLATKDSQLAANNETEDLPSLW